MRPLALALALALTSAAVPTAVFAQTPAPPSLPGQGVTVALQDFSGNATDGYLQGVAGVVRGSLVARGSTVATRTQVNEAIGVSPPTSLLDLARRIGGRMLDPTIAYLTTGTASPTPFARGFRVLERLPIDVARLKRALGERGIGTLEIKKRGVDIDPARLRPKLGLKGDASAVLILTRIAGDRVALLAERAD